MENIRNKMASRGVEALDERELLALLIEDKALAELLLNTYGGSLARLAGEAEARLRMVGGLGLKRARMLRLAAEFGRRVAASGAEDADFNAPSDAVVRLFRPPLARPPHQERWAVYPTPSYRLIQRQRVH